MNKADIIEFVASKADLSKADAERAINAFLECVKDTLKKGLDIVLVGFGTFKTSKRAERMGRNPQTGLEIKIPATTVPVFRAGKSLKDAVNKK